MLLDEIALEPIIPLELTTLAPLLITRLLLLPPLPTKRSPVFVQAELVPVTVTLLFEETESYPIYPFEFTTLAPLLITSLLLLPLLPT